MLNILCDVIRDVIDKHVYVWRVWLIGQFQKRLASKGGHTEQRFS